MLLSERKGLKPVRSARSNPKSIPAARFYGITSKPIMTGTSKGSFSKPSARVKQNLDKLDFILPFQSANVEAIISTKSNCEE